MIKSFLSVFILTVFILTGGIANAETVGRLLSKTTILLDEEVSQSCATTATIDWGTGNAQRVELTGDCTLSFTAPPAGVGNLSLKVKQDSAGGHTLTWPGTVVWPMGQTVIPSGALGLIILTFYHDGSVFYGEAIMATTETITDNAIPRFDGTTGTALQGSAIVADDDGNVTITGTLTVK